MSTLSLLSLLPSPSANAPEPAPAAERASDVLDGLRAARAVLVSTSWVPTVEARDAHGQRVNAIWSAKSYSLVGAIIHVVHDDKLICRLVVTVLGSDGLTKPMMLTTWENAPGRTLDDVLALVDRAIAQQEKL